MKRKIKLELTRAEADAAHWALGNFAMAGNYQDTNGDRRLYSAICRAYDKLVRGMKDSA